MHYRVSLANLLLCAALIVGAAYRGCAQYWAKDFGGTGGDRIADVKVDAQDNVYVIGEFSASMTFGGQTVVSPGGTDVFVAKVDAAGALIWMKRAGGSAIDRGLKLIVSNDGALAVTGQFMGTANMFGTTITSGGGTMDMFVVKLDAATGDAAWVRSGGSGAFIDRPYGVSISPNGNVTVVGEFRGQAQFDTQSLTSMPDPNTGQPSLDVFIASYSSSGTLLWLQQGAAEFADRAIDVVSDIQNNLYVCGQFSDTVAFDVVHNNAMSNATFIIKLDAAGNEQWFRRCGGAAFNHVRDMLLTSTNELLLCGDLQGSMVYVDAVPDVIDSGDPYAYYLLRVGLDGELISSGVMPSQNPVSAKSIDLRADTVAVFGEFDCQFSGLSEHYDGSGLFMAIGDPDLFIARHAFTDFALRDAQQFGGHEEKIAGGITSLLDGSLIFGGTYEKDLIIPRTQGPPVAWGDWPWAQNSTGTECCSYNANLTSYCGDPAYGEFATNGSAGLHDGFVARSYARNRQPYDMWRRQIGSACVRDFWEPCLHRSGGSQCIDTLWLCNEYEGDYLSIIDIELSPFSWQLLDIVVEPSMVETQTGFEVDILWSTGSTGTTTPVLEEGWVWCQVSTRNGCWTWVDSVYAADRPWPCPIIADQAGINDDQCPAEDLFCVDPMWVWCTNVPPDGILYWQSNSGGIENDSLWVDDEDPGYGVFLGSPDGCVQYNGFQVDISPEPMANVTDIDLTLQMGDTLTLCENECGGGSYLLTWYIDGVPSDPPTSGELYQANGCDTWSLPPGEFAYWGVWADTTGWHQLSTTVVYNNLPCELGSVEVTAVDSVYLVVVPIPSGTITAPPVICPGDTLPVVENCPICTAIEWSNEVSVSTSGDTAWFDQPGDYSLGLHVTMNGITCTRPAAFSITAPEGPHLYADPSVICPDSTALICSDMQGTNLAWLGPDGPIASQNDSIWVTVTGDYFLTMTDQYGCEVGNGPLTLNLVSSPYMDVSPGVILCPYESATIEVFTNDPESIQWDAPLSGNSPTQVVTEAGIYSCSVTSCGVTTSLSVEILAGAPNANVPGSPFLLCAGEEITLQGPPGQMIYYWEPMDEYTESITVDQTGDYLLIVIDGFGCSDTSDVLHVEVAPVDQPLSTQDTTVCAGQDAWLVAIGSGILTWYADAGATIVLTVNDSLFIGNAANSATYYVVQEDGSCVTDVTAVQLSVIDVPLTVSISGPASACVGDLVELTTDAPSGTNVSWSTPTGPYTGNALSIASAGLVDGGIYTVNTSTGGCTGGSASHALDVFAPTVLDLGPDTTICDTVIVLQVPGTFTTPTWSDGSTAQQLLVANSGTYAVSAVDANGCTVTDECTVTVEGCGILLPNVLSPNGDGNNDLFVIDARGGQVQFTVFDRWGLVVAELHGSVVKWNGTNAHGEPVPDGVYFHHVHVVPLRGAPLDQTGYVHVMR